MNKSFRGKLEDGEEELIRLSTNNGLTGYKIIKFELMPCNPGAQDSINIVKICTTPRDLIDQYVTFADPTLLAAGTVQNTSSYAYGEYNVIVFDNVTINQDIYISNKDYATGEAINYHIEMEQVKLSENEATVATLKDMRASE